MARHLPFPVSCSPATLLRLLVMGLVLLTLAGCERSQGSSTGTQAPSSVAAPGQRASAFSASTNRSLWTEAPVRALFATALDAGKDPFFPNSPRRKTRSEEASTDPVPETRLPASSYLKLNGLWPSKTRPLALINKTSFAPGERGEISFVAQVQNKPEIRKVQVRVLEIRQRSVLVSVDGEPGTKELRLPDGT
jgi:hypothetical protein